MVAGTYTVTVTDNNGCTVSTSNNITQPAAVAATITVDSNVTCAGFSDGGATASATGGTSPYSYSWNINASTASITGVVAGTYTVTVTDNNGCTGAASQGIAAGGSVSVSATATMPISCAGGSDGTLTASASGGASPYSYAWSNGALVAANSGLAAGSYTVTATDANGCTASGSETLADGSGHLTATITASTATCPNGSDGSLTAAGAGGTAPYTYAWSTGASTATISSLSKNSYPLTVTDANGCSGLDTGRVWFSCDQADGLWYHNLQDTSVRLGWDTVCGATSYKITYKVWGSSTWIIETKEGNVGAYTLENLTPGTRYRWGVRAFCGASDNFGLAAVLQEFTTLTGPCYIPTGLSAGPVQSDQARLNWTSQSLVHKYRIRWREAGQAWNTTIVKDNTWEKHWLTGLSASTTYEWQMKSVCETGVSSGTDWSATQSFTTPSSKFGELDAPEASMLAEPSLNVFPNPSKGTVHLLLEAPDAYATAVVYDVSGRAIHTQRIVANSDNVLQLKPAAGMYVLRVSGNGWNELRQLIVY